MFFAHCCVLAKRCLICVGVSDFVVLEKNINSVLGGLNVYAMASRQCAKEQKVGMMKLFFKLKEDAARR